MQIIIRYKSTSVSEKIALAQGTPFVEKATEQALLAIDQNASEIEKLFPKYPLLAYCSEIRTARMKDGTWRVFASIDLHLASNLAEEDQFNEFNCSSARSPTFYHQVCSDEGWEESRQG